MEAKREEWRIKGRVLDRCSATDMTLLYQPQGTKEENTKERMRVCRYELGTWG